MAFAWNIEESNATEIGAGHEYKSTPNEVEPENQFIDCY